MQHAQRGVFNEKSETPEEPVSGTHEEITPQESSEALPDDEKDRSAEQQVSADAETAQDGAQQE